MQLLWSVVSSELVTLLTAHCSLHEVIALVLTVKILLLFPCTTLYVSYSQINQFAVFKQHISFYRAAIIFFKTIIFKKKKSLPLSIFGHPQRNTYLHGSDLFTRWDIFLSKYVSSLLPKEKRMKKISWNHMAGRALELYLIVWTVKAGLFICKDFEFLVAYLINIGITNAWTVITYHIENELETNWKRERRDKLKRRGRRG